MTKPLTNDIIDMRLKQQKRTICRISDVINSHKGVIWKCKICGNQWNAIPSNVLHRKSGCPDCSKRSRITNEKIDILLKKNNRNIFRIGNIINVEINILWECALCSYIWKATPHNIIYGNTGCVRCSKKIRLTNEYVDKKLEESNIQRVGNVNGNNTKIEWKCLCCNHHWITTPKGILNTHTGCPICKRKNYSMSAIKWLNSLQKNDFIQHAENLGEYLIPGTLLKADGFCEETNTIYEFYGDKFHGNPKIFNPDEKCHPYDKNITAGELYSKTIERENIIKNMGYNLVTIWESEWQ